MPEVSIIIPVYNAGVLLNRCLDSVFSQSVKDVEVILVDDGSKDNSVDIIRERPEQDRIVLLRQSNSGPAAARNKGIDHAHGKYIAFLDADDYWNPGFLEKTVLFLNRNKDAVAVSVAQRHLTTSGDHESPGSWSELSGKDGMIIDDFFSFWSRHNHICTGSIMIRSEVAHQTGGMRPDLRVCEDLEYWAYLSTFGKLGYLPELLFVSDGSKVTEKIGWVEKHLPRWNSAVCFEQWGKRILSRLPDNEKKAFCSDCGRIAQNLAYCILLSKRYGLARNQIREYGAFFPKGKLSRLLTVSSANGILWFLVSRVLVYREYHR